MAARKNCSGSIQVLKVKEIQQIRLQYSNKIRPEFSKCRSKSKIYAAMPKSGAILDCLAENVPGLRNDGRNSDSGHGARVDCEVFQKRSGKRDVVEASQAGGARRAYHMSSHWSESLDVVP